MAPYMDRRITLCSLLDSLKARWRGCEPQLVWVLLLRILWFAFIINIRINVYR